MDFLAGLHQAVSNWMSLLALAMAAWGFFNFFRNCPPDGNFNGALVLVEGVFVVQGLIGMLLVITGAAPGRWVHFLYGITAVLTVPGIFALTRGRNTSRESFFYGAGMLFIWGLIERAADTAN